jgi:hypothetical protein
VWAVRDEGFCCMWVSFELHARGEERTRDSFCLCKSWSVKKKW